MIVAVISGASDGTDLTTVTGRQTRGDCCDTFLRGANLMLRAPGFTCRKEVLALMKPLDAGLLVK